MVWGQQQGWRGTHEWTGSAEVGWQTQGSLVAAVKLLVKGIWHGLGLQHRRKVDCRCVGQQSAPLAAAEEQRRCLKPAVR
jgi:hypothetical protein